MKRWLKQTITLAGACGLLAFGAPPAAALDPLYPLVTVRVDGETLATRGLLMNGRTLLPMRELTKRLGGELRWDSHSKTLWAAFPSQGRTVRMTVNAPVATVYTYDAGDPHKTGQQVQTVHLDQPPVLLGGHVIAPVAAAAEVAGAKVFWEPNQKEVVVQT